MDPTLRSHTVSQYATIATKTSAASASFQTFSHGSAAADGSSGGLERFRPYRSDPLLIVASSAATAEVAAVHAAAIVRRLPPPVQRLQRASSPERSGGDGRGSATGGSVMRLLRQIRNGSAIPADGNAAAWSPPPGDRSLSSLIELQRGAKRLAIATDAAEQAELAGRECVERSWLAEAFSDLLLRFHWPRLAAQQRCLEDIGERAAALVAAADGGGAIAAQKRAFFAAGAAVTAQCAASIGLKLRLLAAAEGENYLDAAAALLDEPPPPVAATMRWLRRSTKMTPVGADERSESTAVTEAPRRAISTPAVEVVSREDAKETTALPQGEKRRSVSSARRRRTQPRGAAIPTRLRLRRMIAMGSRLAAQENPKEDAPLSPHREPLDALAALLLGDPSEEAARARQALLQRLLRLESGAGSDLPLPEIVVGNLEASVSRRDPTPTEEPSVGHALTAENLRTLNQANSTLNTAGIAADQKSHFSSLSSSSSSSIAKAVEKAHPHHHAGPASPGLLVGGGADDAKSNFSTLPSSSRSAAVEFDSSGDAPAAAEPTSPIVTFVEPPPRSATQSRRASVAPESHFRTDAAAFALQLQGAEGTALGALLAAAAISGKSLGALVILAAAVAANRDTGKEERRGSATLPQPSQSPPTRSLVAVRELPYDPSASRTGSLVGVPLSASVDAPTVHPSSRSSNDDTVVTMMRDARPPKRVPASTSPVPSLPLADLKARKVTNTKDAKARPKLGKGGFMPAWLPKARPSAAGPVAASTSTTDPSDAPPAQEAPLVGIEMAKSEDVDSEPRAVSGGGPLKAPAQNAAHHSKSISGATTPATESSASSEPPSFRVPEAPEPTAAVVQVQPLAAKQRSSLRRKKRPTFRNEVEESFDGVEDDLGSNYDEFGNRVAGSGTDESSSISVDSATIRLALKPPSWKH